MNIQEAKEIAALICSEFKVRRPKIKQVRGDAGYYRPDEKLIAIGLKDYNNGVLDPLNTLLHELAHHLEYSKNGGRPAEKNRCHGPQFKAWLIRIAEAWYGNASLYPWQHEYKSLQK